MKAFNILLIALIIRLAMFVVADQLHLKTKLTLEELITYSSITPTPAMVQLGDASDCYITAEKFEVPEALQRIGGYNHWYQRNPLHTLVLYLTNRSIMFQILLSATTVLLLYNLNPIAGWIYTFYPQSIIYSVMFTKVTLMTFLFVLAIYAFRNKKNIGAYLVSSALIIQFLFSSIFNFFPSAVVGTEFHRGIINKVVGLWQPSFDHTPLVVGNWIQYVQAPFYILLMFLFLRRVRWGYEWIIVLIFTAGAAVEYAHPFHREFLLPMLLLATIKTANLNFIKEYFYG